MKKIITFAFMLLFVSAVSFAATGSITLGDNGNAANTKTVELSNNVDANYVSDGGYFAATTVNPKAKDKAKDYLVTSESGATYSKDDAGATVAPTAASDTSGWTKL